MEQRVIKLAKQLYSIKYSTSMVKCMETAIGETYGWKAFSEFCAVNQITKKDYIDYLLEKL